jgi:hypothetical protein
MRHRRLNAAFYAQKLTFFKVLEKGKTFSKKIENSVAIFGGIDYYDYREFESSQRPKRQRWLFVLLGTWHRECNSVF